MRNIGKIVAILVLIFSVIGILRLIGQKTDKSGQNLKSSVSNVSGDSSAIPSPSKSKETQSAVVFFGNNLKGNKSCLQVYPVQRQISKDQNTQVRSALEALLKGPSDEDGSKGYFTNIPPGVKILSFSFQNGVVQVDFDETLERGVSGLCRVAGIRGQINQTLQQFPEVTSVVISIEGRTDKVLQP